MKGHRPGKNFQEMDYDLIIIGAGINGAGIARDAAMRGLSVLLLDKNDLGSGTSSWSTRLIHGGLRYLELGELSLVRESLRERETLLKIAPHLVRPLPILIPIQEDGRRRKTTIRAGMIVYDLLSYRKSVPKHRMLSRAETLKLQPGLNPRGLLGAALYYDAQIEFPERLVLENVLSARQHGAEVLTYAKVQRISSDPDRNLTVSFESRGETQQARAHVVVNASGPWVDQVLEHNSFSQPRLIGGTKGSHVVVAPFDGAPTNAIYLEARSDRRPFFVIPWNNNYLIGTTDVRFDGDPDSVRIESWEANYLLNETNQAFPAAKLTPDNVLYGYVGVRPLPNTTDKTEKKITRRHFLRRHPQCKNLISVVGGKLTTFRSLAEECVDLVYSLMGKRSPKCLTSEVRLPGAARLTQIDGAQVAHNPLTEKVRMRQARIYGLFGLDLANMCLRNPELSEPISEEGDAIAAEIVFAFEHELAATLTDCLMRRTMLGLNRDLGITAAEQAAKVARAHLGWTEDRLLKELSDYRAYLDRFVVEK
jgi:glycerol-3-phosphate dehydrogenase